MKNFTFKAKITKHTTITFFYKFLSLFIILAGFLTSHHSVFAAVPDAPTIGTATAGVSGATVTFTPPASDGGATITAYTVTSSPSSITATSGYTSQYPTAQNGTYVKATTNITNYFPYNATDPAKSLTGDNLNNGWASANNSNTNQRFHIDEGSAKVVTRIYYENQHTSGTNTTFGVKNFTFWGSNSATDFNDLVYADDGTWTQLTTSASSFTQHVASDTTDPKYITVTNSTPYRYYAFKFADGYGGTWIGFRRVELQTGNPVGSPMVITGLANNTSYTFTVTATNSFGTGAASAASNSITTPTTPGTPTIGTATAGNTSVTLTFTPPSNGGSPIINYTATSSPGGITSTSGYVNQYPPAQSSTYVKATTTLAGYNQYYATDPSLSLIGANTTSWVSSANTITNQRFHIDAGSTKVVTRIYYENMHSSGNNTTGGVKNFTLWGSNSSTDFNDTTYINNGTWTQLTTSQSTFDQHSASDAVDPKYITVTNSTPYRYYAFKFADNWGLSNWMGLRRVVLQTGNPVGSPMVITGLTNSTAYTFTVTATNAVGTSSSSSASNSVTPSSVFAPGAPTIGTATAGNASATVTFTPPGSDGGSAITGYTVTSSPGGITGTGSASPITVSGLTNGTPYTFTVTATNAVGTSSASAASNSVTPVVVFAPGAPTIGTATVGGTGSATVTFTPPGSDGGSAITGYTVTSSPSSITAVSGYTPQYPTAQNGTYVKATSTNTTFFPYLATDPAQPLTGSNSTSWASSTNSITNQRFHIDEGSSKIITRIYYENQHTAGTNTTGGVKNFTIWGSNSATDFNDLVYADDGTWTQLTTSQSAFNQHTASDVADPQYITVTNSTAYRYYAFKFADNWGLSSFMGLRRVVLQTGNPVGSPMVITGLAGGTAYTFTVTATNAVGTSSASAASNSITTPNVPSAPTIGTATAGNASATVTFTPPGSDGGSAIMGYTVTSSPGGITATSGYYNQYPLAQSGTYVKATSTYTTYSPYLATDPTIPLTGTNLNTVWVSNANLNTKQRFHIDEGSAKVVTRIYYENEHSSGTLTNGGVKNFTFWGSNSSTDFNDTTYANDGTWVPLTTSQSVFNQHVAADTPDPQYITVTNSTAYRYYAFKFADNYGLTNWMGLKRIVLQTGNPVGSPLVIPGLTNSTPYTFTVTATNAVGTSSASAASNSVTPATIPPGQVTGLVVTPFNKKVSLNWVAPSMGDAGISDYFIEYKLSSSGSWSTFSHTASSKTKAVITGLINNLSYDFRVSAISSVGTGTASAVVSGTPVPITTLAFVIAGESNAGGVGLNSSATVGEMALQPQVQITNLTSGFFLYENMQIGVNNLRDHTGLEAYYTTRHGFELELSNLVSSNTFPDNSLVYLTKTGQGGSRVAQWDVADASGYWTKFLQRINAAKTQLPAQKQWVVWYSQGINDAIDALDTDTWKTRTIAHLNKIKTELPGCIIVMTEFESMSGYTAYNTAIQEIAASEPNVFSIDSTGAALQDSNHWSYAGHKTVTDRLATATVNALGLIYPGTPTSLGTNTSVAGQVSLSWTAPVANGGSSITDYLVEYKTNASPTWLTFNDGVSTTPSATVTGLSNGTLYNFRVSAVNTNGSGNPVSGNAATISPDTTPPTASVTYSDADAIVKSGDSLTITATFSEPIADSPIMKIAISGSNTVAATNMTKVDTTHYTYVHTVGAGDGTATVALSVGTDAAGNVVTSAPTSGATFTVNNTVTSTTHNSGGGLLIYLQNQNNIPQNNTIPVNTNTNPTDTSSIYGSKTSVVRINSRGTSAENVQRAINQLKAVTPPLVIDGKIGKKSVLGIMAVQKILGIKADGIWGKNTQNAYESWIL